MSATLGEYILIILSSSVKFVAGPILGHFQAHLPLVETIAFTTIGMMFSVTLLTYAGSSYRQRIVKRIKARKSYKLFTKKNRRIVKVWTKFGIQGVAFLTPVLLTPIGGALIAISFGVEKRKILLYMFISALFWSIIVSSLVYAFSDLAAKLFHQMPHS